MVCGDHPVRLNLVTGCQHSQRIFGRTVTCAVHNADHKVGHIQKFPESFVRERGARMRTVSRRPIVTAGLVAMTLSAAAACGSSSSGGSGGTTTPSSTAATGVNAAAAAL